MSINGELQRMLKCDEEGTFLTDEKKKELKELNEGVFSAIGSLGGDLFKIIKGATKGMVNIASATGKAIGKGLRALDEKEFSKKLGAKNVEDIDKKLSQMKANDPEFYAVLKEVMVKKVITKKINKELYDSLNDIFQRHMERAVKYYQNLLKTTKDGQQATMYYGVLLDMLKWLEKPEDKILRDTILASIAEYMDKQTLNPVELKKDRLTPEEEGYIQDPESMDTAARELKVDDPNLITFVKMLAKISAKISKGHKAYVDVHDVFNTQLNRLVDYYSRAMTATKDVNKSITYNGILVDILNYLDPVEHKQARTKIKNAITAQADKAANSELKAMEEKMKKESEEARKEAKPKAAGKEKAPPKKEMPEDTHIFEMADIPDVKIKDITNFGLTDLGNFLEKAKEYVDAVQTGRVSDLDIPKPKGISNDQHTANIIAKADKIKDAIKYAESRRTKLSKK